MSDAEILPANEAARSTRPLISISVVSHGQGALVRRMLESLIAHPPPAELEILLTENLPVGRTEIPTLPGWDLVRVENAKPQGYARRCDSGLLPQPADSK